ncbi:hypothetical protein ACJX0J_021701, partial [Zea mays]
EEYYPMWSLHIRNEIFMPVQAHPKALKDSTKNNVNYIYIPTIRMFLSKCTTAIIDFLSMKNSVFVLGKTKNLNSLKDISKHAVMPCLLYYILLKTDVTGIYLYSIIYVH